MPLADQPVKARGPAAEHPSALAPDNPYNFPSRLRIAAELPPKTTDQYVFFFGYEGTDPHVCFQQWFPCVFIAASWTASDRTKASGSKREFGTTEQYMMHAKAMLMKDDDTAAKIASATHPSEAKLLGRQVRDFDQEKWNACCEAIVEEANYAKFSQNEDLKEVLVGTGQRTIVEASPDDKIWGIGFDTDHAEGKESEWGSNLLGKVLMKVRERLQQQ